MGRTLTLGYGVLVYVLFLGTFVYFIGFAAGFEFMPNSVNSGTAAQTTQAMVINLAMLGLFAAQHFIMARPWFKRRWTEIIPETFERSTYVLATTLIVLLMLWQWQPMPGLMWHIENPIGMYCLWGLWGVGWVVMLYSTFLVDHFDLFGLRQVYLCWRGVPYTQVQFKMRSLYRYVRHPMMVGFIIAFWATPKMSAGHLLFALASTGMILIGIQLEERDLLAAHGASYEEFRRRVPMLIPRLSGAAPITASAEAKS